MKNPTSFEEFWPIYLRAHSEPATRALHVGGAVVGLGCGAVFLATGHPLWALAGLVAAYGAAWIGHALIERNVPGAGKMSEADLKGISQKSCGVLRDMGTRIQWQQSYVTDDKIYCVYRAPNEEIIREHAERGGFPANKISQVRSVIDPTTAE